MVDLNKIADKLEDKYLGQQTDEAKEILAFVQFYRIRCAMEETTHENSGLHKHIVSNNEVAVCDHDSITYTKIHNTVYKQCLKCRELLGAK